MFAEPHIKGEKAGWIEVVCGGMFSGKTEELIRRLRRAEIAKQKVAIFKPQVDDRFDDVRIVSHDARSIPSTPVALARDIIRLSGSVDVAGIDEAQFFDDQLPDVCVELAVRGIRVVIAGLDMDFTGAPFGPMPQLMALADYVTKLQAICQQCGNPATHSYRLTDYSGQILVGEKAHYEPRCRQCFVEGMSTKQPSQGSERLTS
jgi:thymidine kinase